MVELKNWLFKDPVVLCGASDDALFDIWQIVKSPGLPIVQSKGVSCISVRKEEFLDGDMSPDRDCTDIVDHSPPRREI